VIFTIPGLGGSPYTKASHFLGEKLYEQGYHVILLPSPFSWHFALGASRDGIVGITQKDSEDLYSAMLHIKELVTKKYSMQIQSVGVLGYSLGALHSAFIEKIDQEEKLLNIKTVLAINPPVDLVFGLNRLDEYYKQFQNDPEAKKTTTHKVFNLFMNLSGNNLKMDPLRVFGEVAGC
jgi:ABC-type phosphate transport system auxiliary subunit